MSMTNPHSLVVPEQVAPAFQGEILPKQAPTLAARPKTFKGKVGRFFQKSTLITAPVLGLSFSSFFLFGPGFLEFNFISAMVVMVGGTVGTGFSLLWTMNAVESLNQGDNELTPLPPTKKHLELEAERQKPVIQPFKDWDDMFSKNVSKLEVGG